MKTTSKRLAVLILIAALALILPVVMASADDHGGKKAIEGEYAFTGPGNCFVAAPGFDDNYVPIPGGFVLETPAQIWKGTYTFKRDGSGTMTSRTQSLDILPAPALNVANISWAFKYKMTDHTKFTYHVTPGTYDTVEWIAGPNAGMTSYFEVDGPCDGVLSQDGETLTVTCGPPTMLTAVDPTTGQKAPFQAYCSFSHVGIRVDK